jgi:hypothetical protein
LVRLLLFLPEGIALRSILTLAVIVGLFGAYIALKLQDTYVGVLEKNLLRRAADMEIGQFSGSILSSMTMIQVPISREDLQTEALASRDEVSDNRLLTAHRYMVSGDPVRVQHALRDYPDLDPLLVPAAIRLLATDAVYGDVVRALRRVAEENVGQLVDALLDPKTDPLVRRRIPRVLSHCRTQRAAEGLLLGVRDASLEVRYRCGRALSAIGARSAEIVVDSNVVYEAVKWEAAQSRPDGARQALPDLAGDEEMSHITSDSLKGRADRRLEHIFTLLSIVLPREPLRVAFHGLHTDERHLRGTALEYLESVLPPDLLDLMTPFLAGERAPRSRDKSTEEVAQDLMNSQESIMSNLDERRRPR